MPKIILASQSEARKKLLKQVGIKFQIVKPSVKEDNFAKTNARTLVINNALKKAKDVAKRFSSGIVIGADTAVVCKGKIIGKPKNANEAFETLKLLSKEPQWVYTGLAIINIDKNKTITSYEKTKVFMYELSNDDIRNYFRKISPLDKAGSFDIQGLGSIFVRRIEGCFYNVVGLPLAKLIRILEKEGVNVFSMRR